MKALFLTSALLVAALGSTAALAMPDHAMGHSAKASRMMMKCQHMDHAKAMKNKACAAMMMKHDDAMKGDAMHDDAMKGDAMTPDAMGHH